MGPASGSPANSRVFVSIYDLETGEVMTGGGNDAGEITTTYYSLAAGFGYVDFTSKQIAGTVSVRSLSGEYYPPFNTNQVSGFDNTIDVPVNTKNKVSSLSNAQGYIVTIGFSKE